MTHQETRHLRPGEWVEVLSVQEILATLDADGALEGLPFMPEMEKFCGLRFRVAARADRTVHDRLGLRRMTHAVHLEDLRCDGAAHDGCCRGCLIFWKEAWLRRPDQPRPVPPATPSRPLPTTLGGGYFCQATQLARATSRHPLLSWRDFRAPAVEGLPATTLLYSLAILGYDVLMRRVRGKEWNALTGPCRKTPSVSLGLRPGERVRVKSKREILATLDTNGWNRGMEFSREMLPFCGRELSVLRRVERIIRDDSNRMLHLKDTVILDGAVYRALNRRAVPRRQFMFWRECWLERT